MIESISTAYGPIGFGLIAVIVLWRVIIAPELALQREGIQTLATIANATRETAASCNQAAEKAQDAAQILAATCPRTPERNSPCVLNRVHPTVA